jgi:hypothetical protein
VIESSWEHRIQMIANVPFGLRESELGMPTDKAEPDKLGGRFDAASISAAEVRQMLSGQVERLSTVRHVILLQGRLFVPRICALLDSKIGMLGNAPLLNEDLRPFTGAIQYSRDWFDRIWSIQGNQEFARRSGFKEDTRNFLIVPVGSGGSLIEEYGQFQKPGDEIGYEELLQWSMKHYQRSEWIAMPLETDRDAILFMSSNPTAVRALLTDGVEKSPSAVLSAWIGPEQDAVPISH